MKFQKHFMRATMTISFVHLNQKVFIYCQGGKRAEACQEILKKEGIDAESIGGFNELKNVLPTKTLHQRLNEPFSGTEAFNRKNK